MPLSESILKLIHDNKDGYIILDNRGLLDSDIPDLVVELKNIPKLISLDLTRNNIRNKGAKDLAVLALRELNIHNNSVGDEGALFLLKSPTLRWLDISKNNISDKTIDEILKNTLLLYVDAEDNSKISEESYKKLRHHIDQNCSMSKFTEEKSISENKEKDEIVEARNLSAQSMFSEKYQDDSKENGPKLTANFPTIKK
jgi:hypothetical protein